ncbi:MAG: hypothetical protein GY856_20730, partial [bacterium]|nr:hypothetical protein [bacterium]
HPLAPEPPTEAELRAYYDEHVDARQRHARRMVYHLFKRYRPDGTRDEVKAEVEALRRRIVGGESFSALAAAHSDSELRHLDGMLGLVERGQLAPELDEIVFSLEENVPSEPITTGDGVHLFLVKLAVEAKEFTFDELRGQAAQAIRARKSEELVARLVDEGRADVDVYAAGDEELRALVVGDDPDAPVLRVGDYELRVAGFRTLLLRAARRLGGEGAGFPVAYLKRLKQRELIYQRLVRDQRLDAAEVERRLDRRRDQELAGWALEKRLARFPEERPERLHAHYESNKMRFSTPLELDIRRLIVPLGDDPGALMVRLEAARAVLDAGTVEFDALAAELGGRVEDLGWTTLAELRRIEPKAVIFAGRLVAGRHCAPYRSPAGLEILEVTGRRDPAAQPFAEVSDRVREDFLRSYAQELVAELAEELLAQARLTVHRERLQELLETGFGAIDG